MKSIAVPCLECGHQFEILIHEGNVFVASATLREAEPRKSKIKRNGGDGPKPLDCKECGRVFFRAASLGVHRRKAHGVKGKGRK